METKPQQRVTPFLWFNGRVGEALDFYTQVFKESKILGVSRQGEKIFTASFELNGLEFMALDGGPMFTFSPATSFFVKCKTQDEVDWYWEKLSEGGKKSRCGWLDDKFGITWQIVPDALGELLYDKNPVKSKNVMDAMLKMDKLIIADLHAAYDKQ